MTTFQMPSPHQLAETTCEILEETAFIFASPSDMRPVDDPSLLLSSLRLFDGIEGSLLLAVPHAVGVEIAGNLLGLDPDEPEAADKAADAVGEILNILAGALAARGVDERGCGFRFGTPTTAAVLPADTTLFGKADCAAAILTDQGLRLWAALVVGPAATPSEQAS